MVIPLPSYFSRIAMSAALPTFVVIFILTHPGRVMLWLLTLIYFYPLVFAPVLLFHSSRCNGLPSAISAYCLRHQAPQKASLAHLFVDIVQQAARTFAASLIAPVLSITLTQSIKKCVHVF